MPRRTGPVCTSCNGLGLVIKSQKPGYTEYIQCTTCSGRGVIT